MNVLVVGSGGREHVLAWKLRQSPRVKTIVCAPGNGGMAGVAECADVAADDIDGLVRLVKEKHIDLTVVGPEAPLVAGLVDAFRLNGMKVFGPSGAAARLEGSKVFAKEFMRRHRIPTADFRVFDQADPARAFVGQTRFPLVIKADGLASGKGVFVCQNAEEALDAVDQVMGRKIFHEAGDRVVVEECLNGEEVSILAVSDGLRYVILASSQDHKRIFDDDLGPNTGGMGAYSPAPAVSKSLLYRIDQEVIAPTIKGMAQEGCPFTGVLYAGLMVTPEGPKVLEYNVRLGDPETQAVLPRMKNDLLEVLEAACDSRMDRVFLQWDPRDCVCVVMSSGGYPGPFEKGKVISGLETAGRMTDVMVFHSGTRKDGSRMVTSGGRVLGVTALGDGVADAVRKAYKAVEEISFDRCFFRRDIGARALSRVAPAPGK